MQKKLKKWNEWWLLKKVPPERTKIIRSEKLKKLTKLLSAPEMIILSGVRRSGKSTLIYQLIQNLLEKKVKPENILYFNLDEPLEKKGVKILQDIYSSYLELQNPKGKIYLFLDEIQNIDNWHQWIKSNYDLHGGKIKFILTGSNSSLLNDSLSKHLTGRTLIEHIYPLSFKEFLTFNKISIPDADLEEEKIRHHLGNYFKKGGFPEAVLEKNKYVNEKRLRDYFDGILFRDVISAKKIRETAKMKDLAYFALTNISNPLSYSKIEKTIGLNIVSVKEYLSYLEDAFLLFQIHFFSYSIKESIAIQKPRKIYAIDQGLRQAASYSFSEDKGRIAENIVFLELKRNQKDIYYWKDKNEIDFVVKNDNNSIDLINVSFTNTMEERETKGFLQFEKNNKKIRKKIIITDNLEKKSDGIEYIPLYKFLLQ